MKKGFTLIELLIVAAIIAILAAIAVPNFLEAQTRAKVSRVKADMRSIATGLEAYSVDNNKYPWDGAGTAAPDPAISDSTYFGTKINDPDGTGRWGIFHMNNMLTTPISYLTTVDFKDPFNSEQDDSGPNGGRRPWLRYMNMDGTYRRSANTTRQNVYKQSYAVYGAYVLSSFGPNKITDTVNATTNPIIEGIPGATASSLMTRYDPTNGTISKGDVMRCHATSEHPKYSKFPLE